MSIATNLCLTVFLASLYYTLIQSQTGKYAGSAICGHKSKSSPKMIRSALRAHARRPLSELRSRQSPYVIARHRQHLRSSPFHQQYQRFGRSHPGSSWIYRWAASPSFYYQIGGLSVAAGAFYTYNLEEVPVSHRRRFNVISESFDEQIASQLGDETKAQFQGRILPEWDKRHVMVQRVLDRLVPHTGLQDKQWEIHVIDDPQKNAFVVPGGKVFVFTGILPICADEVSMSLMYFYKSSRR